MSLEDLARASNGGCYRPEEFGAQCERCYLYKLRQGGPVPPEINPGSKILIAAEAPGKEEVKFNRPLIGKSGTETIAGLATVGLMRSQVSLTNCFVCHPPGDNLDALLLRMKKENKERAAQGLELYLSPMEACRPRFIYELRLFQDVISLGKPAFQSLTGTNQSIMDARGMPLDGILDGHGKYHTALYVPEPGETVTKLRVLPTVHPAFVLRKKRWRGTFRVDLSRAVRWFSGDLQWKEPQCVHQPSPQQLEEFLLKEKHPFVVYDVETGSPNLDMPHLGKEPLLARLRCIGFSTTEFGMVVPFLSIDGVSTFYPSDEQEAINEICRAHFLDPKVVKAGHNCLYGDTRVLLADGSSRTIQSIVRARQSVMVRAIASDGTLTTAKVVDWVKVRRPNQNWRVIRLAGQKSWAHGLRLTPDHEILTSRGLVRADLVLVGDHILTNEPALQPFQAQAVLGTLFGDSTLLVSPTRKREKRIAPTAAIRGGHTFAAHTRWKAKLLPFLSVGAVEAKGSYGQSMLYTFQSAMMRQMAKYLPLVFAKDGSRHITVEGLNQLGPCGLAWWFMDDGHQHRKGAGRRATVALALCRYDFKSKRRVQTWIRSQFGPCGLSTSGVLELSLQATEPFVKAIAPHVFPVMRYKLPEWVLAPSWQEPMLEKPRPYPVQVLSNQPWLPERGSPKSNLEAETSWCLTTTAGNFITNFGAVKNCGYYDRLSVETNLGVTPAPTIDTILLHRGAESELPHKLGYVGTTWSPITKQWKTEHTALTAKTDKDLWDYCLNAGTRVMLADGSTESIETLVQRRYSGEVLTRADDGTVVPRRVIGWHRNRVERQEWIQIEHGHLDRRERGLVLTPEHQILTVRGWIPAVDVRVGDEISISEPELTPYQHSAILGTLLGDSVLVASPTWRVTGRLAAPTLAISGGHVASSRLVPFKLAVLQPMLHAQKGLPARVAQVDGKTCHCEAFERYSSSMSPQLAQMARYVYDAQDQRRLFVSTLEAMGPVGWAWWFADDGCRQNGGRAERNNGSRGGRLSRADKVALATNGFPREDVDAAVIWFRKKFGPTTAGRDNVLRLGVDASHAFCTAIAPHLPDGARYKLPRDAEWPDFVPPQSQARLATWLPVVRVGKYEPKRKTAQQRLRAETRWCIDVEGNHNFFTTSGLVHNCLVDCTVTERILEPLMQAVAARGLTSVVAIHHELQGVCAGMHRNGLFVDQARRKQHDVWLQREAAHHRQVLRQTIGAPSFNPNSRDQVAEVLFERWGLTPEIIYENDPSASRKIKKAYTAAGAPSTGDDNLRAMLLFCPRNSEKWTFINALRKFRGAAKLRGTNIIPLRPIDVPYYEGDDLSINLDVEEEARSIDEWDESQVERDHDAKGPARRLKLKEKKPGLVLFDGRVHPHWNAHTATTQRFASSEPNGQNWSRKIRDIVHAQQTDGWTTTNVMVGGRLVAFHHPEKFTRALIAADMDQLELRFAAALAGAARYLEVFAKGGDPHAVTCEMLYGDTFKHASEEGKKRLRDFAKRFSYAVLYKATVETVHETLASSENDAGELVFPDLTLRETRNFHERWMRGSPEFGDVDGTGGWWLREIEEYRRQGYLVEPIFGWRRDFLDGEEDSANEIVNFKSQAGGSAVVHLATLKYLKYMPFGRWGPGTGLIQQGHDALMVEVPATHGPTSFRIDKLGEPVLDKFGQPIVDKWCPKGCKCPTETHRQELQEVMTVDGHPFGLPVQFTASGKAGFRWSEV